MSRMIACAGTACKEVGVMSKEQLIKTNQRAARAGRALTQIHSNTDLECIRNLSLLTCLLSQLDSEPLGTITSPQSEVRV